jgi:hypothetical protein
MAQQYMASLTFFNPLLQQLLFPRGLLAFPDPYIGSPGLDFETWESTVLLA